jgi:hypothetical protein
MKSKDGEEEEGEGLRAAPPRIFVPGDGHSHEIVAGRLVPSTKPKRELGRDYYVEGEGAVEGSQKKKKARGDDAAETEEDVEEKVEAAAAEEEDLLKPPEPRNMECFVKTVVEEYRRIKEQPFRFFLKYEAVPRYIGELEADVELQRGVINIFERIDEERTFASAIRFVKWACLHRSSRGVAL